MAGRFLEISSEKLAAIDRENDTEEQRKVALLHLWSRREGRGASCLKLASMLHRRERADLVDPELLCVNVRASLMLDRTSINHASGEERQACPLQSE